MFALPAALVDQPASRQPVSAVRLFIGRHGRIVFFQFQQFFRFNCRIFEETACVSSDCRIGQFALPDIDNHPADVSCCGIGHFSGSEFFIHLGIRHIGVPCLRQRETNIENDEPAFEIRLENTVPIGELAIGLVEFDDFSIPEIERLAAEEGPGILLTVDCGISDVKAVERAKELGFMVVVSDHHMPPEELPPAHAITNPRLSEDNPCPHLAGVGVAFFLMAALNGKLEAMSGKRMDMRQVLDLVALGTLADMVSLTGQNRILVKNGLLKIAEAKRPGLAELKGASGFSPVAALGAGQVVFNLAPRINAAGRLGSPTLAHDMLLTPSHDEAAKLAQTLTSLNDERRSEEDRIYKEALEQAEANPKRLGFVLYGKDWHQGVIGIVASRIVEVYYRPVLILCSDGESLKGSGRSVPEFDLHAGLTRCADMLLGFGGHRQAAGLRIAPGRLDELRERFDAVIREELGEEPLTPSLKIDAEMPFSQASDFTVLKGLELLQPFGIGNPEPIFASLPLRVKKRKAFGHSREHISLEVTEEGSGITLQAKAWRQADQIPENIQGQRIRLAYTPGINAYNGIASVELRVRDWKVL